MYTQFFGLDEIPFSIAPNPHFLYMSERHKEALAHLSYGLGETGGFVLLTGEVGTGKTTVSRCLLEQLGDDTQVAFILNPALSAQELLATICDELKIRYRKTGATLKTLTDKISDKLLKNHQNNINTVLIIDEAQHLQAEVLEQLRLLTNLETNTKKLIQVILIGQPELQHLLQRQDLRQLAQRITARYHLLPLTKEEVKHYIEHRLRVVGCQQTIFTQSALSAIHQLSKGVPRLINLLCDRALLGAYGLGKHQVDKAIIYAASKEALGIEYQPQPWWKKTWLKAVGLILLLSTFMLAGIWFGQQGKHNNEVAQYESPQQSTLTNNQQGSFTLSELIISNNVNFSNSLVHLFNRWRVVLDEEVTQPCEIAQLYQLSCHWFKGNLAAIKRMNYPASMQFIDSQGQAFYGNLVGIKDKQLIIAFSHGEELVDPRWLDKYWQGAALIFWQPPMLNGQEVTLINHESDITSIQWLENNLASKQQRPIRQVASFDHLLENQLNQFQRRHGIMVSSTANLPSLLLLANQSSQGMPLFQSDE